MPVERIWLTVLCGNSQFGKQEGDFSIELISLSARKAQGGDRKSEL